MSESSESGTDVHTGADAFATADVDARVEPTVAVVGAGAVGATVAYDLAQQGADVTLYDRDSVGAGSSGRAAGVCYDVFADELDAEIGRESIERFRDLSDEDTFEFVECPYVWLAREGDDRSRDAIEAQIPRMQDNGIVALEMDGDALGERFPSLRTDDVAIAGVAGGAGYADPATYTASLADLATAAGASLETQTPVEIRTDPPRVLEKRTDGHAREFDTIVVTAGAHTNHVLETAGLSVAMKPYRVQALVTAADVTEPMCYDATGAFYVRPHPDGLLAGNGTETVEADLETWDRDANDGFASDLRSRIAHRFPDAAIEAGSKHTNTVSRAWAGLCTATPDRDPLVGELVSGVYVATGFQGHGFMRAPAIGRRLAVHVLGASAREVSLETFDPTRYSGTEHFEIVEGMAVDDIE